MTASNVHMNNLYRVSMDNLAKQLNRSYFLQVQNFSHAISGTLTHSKSMRFYHLSM